jgi:hypothetical protein
MLSVATMAVLECLVPTGSKNYLQHMLGLECLLGSQKPHAYWSSQSTELYKCVRYMILFASIHNKTPSILARPEWKWAFRARCLDFEDTQEQDLFDVLADCTVLISSWNDMSTNQPPSHVWVERRGIMNSALALLTALRRWKQRWDAQGVKLNFSSNFQPHLDSRNPKADDTVPEYFLLNMTSIGEPINTSETVMLIFYYMALIQVYEILKCSIPPDQKNDYNSELNTSEIMTNRTIIDEFVSLEDLWKADHGTEDCIVQEREAAVAVCHCVSYYLNRTPHQSKGHSSVLYWAILSAWKVLQGNQSSEARWMMGVITNRAPEILAGGIWGTDSF